MEREETMGGRAGLVAFNRQFPLLSEDLQRRECGLIEIGRKHARGFDAGHAPSGGGVQRVLTELRKLAERMASLAATPVRSVLDTIRARCADRITCSAVVVSMCDSGV